ncbi:MAG: hypothetical protein HYY13_02105, partial [Nitrospirae bacterium]|nr:hypothetical protein [Nitrospirota bacterium]
PPGGPPPLPPIALSITSPATGAFLPPQLFTLSATVTNDVAPTTVYFYLDQAPLAALTAAPYSGSVDPTYYSGGSHVLTVEAVDSQTRVGAASITVTFMQPAVSAPTLVKRVISNGDLNLVGSTLHVPCWDGGSCLFDVANPASPALTAVKPGSAAPLSTSILPYVHSGSTDRLWGNGYLFTLGLGAVSLLAGADSQPSGDYVPLAAGTSILLTGGSGYVNRTLYIPLAVGPTPEIGAFEFSDPSQGRLGLGLKRTSTLPVPTGISNPGLAMMRAGGNLLAAVWKDLSTSANYLALYDLQLGLKSNTPLTGKIVQSMTLSGTRLYLLVSSTAPPYPLTLEVHDVSNPQIPALLGTYNPSRNLAVGTGGLDLAVSGNTAYFSLGASSAPTLLALDVTNPGAISLLGSLGSGSTGLFGKLLLSSNRLYATRTTASGVVITTGLSIVDVSSPSAPTELSYTLLDSTDDEIGLMERQGAYLYALSKWGYALHTIDAVTLQSVHKIPSATAYATYLTTRPGWLFAVTLFGLRSYSLAAPAAPALSDTLTVTLSSLAALGNYVFGVSNATDKFEAIDATDPANLLGPTSLPIPNAPALTNLACAGSYCYVPFSSPSSGTQGIHVIDVSIPTSPSILSTVALPSGETPNSVFVSGNHLYLTSVQTGLGPTLRIYDITVGASPSLLSTLVSTALPATWAQFALSGQTLCIGSGIAFATPLVCLGVQNPSLPNISLKKALPAAAGLAVAADGSILVSTGSHILRVQP